VSLVQSENSCPGFPFTVSGQALEAFIRGLRIGIGSDCKRAQLRRGNHPRDMSTTPCLEFGEGAARIVEVFELGVEFTVDQSQEVRPSRERVHASSCKRGQPLVLAIDRSPVFSNQE